MSQVDSRPEARARLLDLLTARAYEKREVTLTSGRRSNFFIDCKQAVLSAEGHVLVGLLLLDAVLTLPGSRPRAVAGVELGGCSLASAVALTSALQAHSSGPPLDAIYVRKEAKEHGSRRMLEGNTHLPQRSRVAVVEDVVTTGGSTIRSVQQLRTAGYEVTGVVALIDRQEGGREAIEASGMPFQALFVRADFPA